MIVIIELDETTSRNVHSFQSTHNFVWHHSQVIHCYLIDLSAFLRRPLYHHLSLLNSELYPSQKPWNTLKSMWVYSFVSRQNKDRACYFISTFRRPWISLVNVENWKECNLFKNQKECNLIISAAVIKALNPTVFPTSWWSKVSLFYPQTCLPMWENFRWKWKTERLFSTHPSYNS